MDYREFYEEQTKQKIPEDFEIHHINFDRSDNEITNLVALPVKVHSDISNMVQKLNSILPDDITVNNKYYINLLTFLTPGNSVLRNYERQIINHILKLELIMLYLDFWNAIKEYFLKKDNSSIKLVCNYKFTENELPNNYQEVLAFLNKKY